MKAISFLVLLALSTLSSGAPVATSTNSKTNTTAPVAVPTSAFSLDHGVNTPMSDTAANASITIIGSPSQGPNSSSSLSTQQHLSPVLIASITAIASGSIALIL